MTKFSEIYSAVERESVSTLSDVLNEQRLQESYDNMFESSAEEFWSGIYEIHTQPLTESVAEQKLESLEKLIFETAIQLPIKMLSRYDNYLDNYINEGFLSGAKELAKAAKNIASGIIDKADEVASGVRGTMGKAVKKGVEVVGKAAKSLLDKAVSKEMQEKIKKLGKDVKDKIFNLLKEQIKKLSPIFNKIKKMVDGFIEEKCGAKAQQKSEMTESLNILFEAEGSTVCDMLQSDSMLDTLIKKAVNSKPMIEAEKAGWIDRKVVVKEFNDAFASHFKDSGGAKANILAAIVNVAVGMITGTATLNIVMATSAILVPGALKALAAVVKKNHPDAGDFLLTVAKIANAGFLSWQAIYAASGLLQGTAQGTATKTAVTTAIK